MRFIKLKINVSYYNARMFLSKRVYTKSISRSCTNLNVYIVQCAFDASLVLYFRYK